MERTTSRIPVGVLYALASVLFWVPLAGAVFGLPLSVATLTGSDKPLAIHGVIAAADAGADLGAGVELEDPVAVVVPLGDVTTAQVVAYEAALVVAAAVYLYAAWQLRQLVRSIRDRDAFVPANVRRLRVIGASILLGYPLFQWVSSGLNEWMLSNAGTAANGVRVVLEPFSFPAIVGGLCLLVLAEVFAHGIALREDVEATV